MTQCLNDKTLFLLSEGEATEAQRSHLQSCQACSERYRDLERDLGFITDTLQHQPLRFPAPRASLFYRSLPIAAGVLLAVALMWGESRVWRPSSPSGQTLDNDISQFLEQVSEAIFNAGSVREAGTALPDSDLASVQVALGENCSAECQELFDNSLLADTKSNTGSMNRPFVTAKKRPLDPTMQHMVADRAE
jgi:hypothetical protein